MSQGREYRMHGPERLGDAELLAVALGSLGAGASALQVAARLLDDFGGLEGLAHAAPQALAEIGGVGPARAARLHAALQAGRRSFRVARPNPVVRCPEDAHAALAPTLRGLPHEELHALYLDRRRRPIAQRLLTRGSDAFTVVDPRQVFRAALQVGASALVLAHNHPSGDATPSAQDREVTRRIASAGRVLGVQLVDHLVIADLAFSSLAALGELPPWSPEQAAWVAEASLAGSPG